MNNEEHIPLYKRLIDDELIIGESVSDLGDVRKVIEWYRAIMLDKKRGD